MQLLSDTIAPGLSPAQLELFATASNRLQLDPFRKQIYAIVRWDSELGRNKMTIQTSIDGFRAIAERTGVYGGRKPFEWCGKDGVWKDVWLDDQPPCAARARIIRKDWAEPLVSVARFKAYVQTKKDGSPTHMWKKMDAEQLAKCAESLGLRTAFPDQLSGVYTDDEMAQGEIIESSVPALEKPPAAKLPPLALTEDRLRGIGKGPLAGRVLEECTFEELGNYIARIEKLDPAKRAPFEEHLKASGEIRDRLAAREVETSIGAVASISAAVPDAISEGLEREVKRMREPGDDDESYLSEGGAP
jgi:phage recombination protein Bet